MPTILVTRPDPQGSQLCAILEETGLKACHFPTLEIHSLTHTPLFQKKCAQLADQDWLIFLSPQSVYQLVPVIKNLPTDLKCAAVGASTAQALREAGFPVHAYPESNWNSEAILLLPEFQTPKGKRIMIVAGVDGRETLAHELTAKGAQITKLFTYQRVLPNKTLPTELLSDCHAIIAASFTSIKNLQPLCCELDWPKLLATPLVVPSQRIKILAEGLGFQTIWEAFNASHAEILKVIQARL